MKSYSRKTCLNFAFFKSVLLLCTCQYCIVTVGVGSGKQAVMLQSVIISGWERCPFATMASLVFHASSSQFQVFPHSAYHGQVQLCSLQQAAFAGWAYCDLHEWVHVWTKFKSPSCSKESQLLQQHQGKGFQAAAFTKTLWNCVGKLSFAITRWRNFRIFLNREGCNLSQTVPVPSENSDISRYLPFCQQHWLAFCISDSWRLEQTLTHVTHKNWNPNISAYSGSTI